MSDPQTSNVGFYQPTRGSDVGTWDLPVNANEGATDTLFANVAAIALSNSDVLLTTPPNSGASWSGPYQSQSGILRFTGTLLANVRVTLPRAGFWIVDNICTVGNFVVSIASASPGHIVGLPPGEATHVYNDGTDVKFVDFGRIGAYVDMAVTAVPNWITACTIPPYLNCDGSSFSAGTYPALASYLGGTTLPDLRGRIRAALNQGTGRISAAGVNGSVFLAAGGADTETIAQANLPAYNLAVVDPGHVHVEEAGVSGVGATYVSALSTVPGGPTGNSTSPATTNISVNLNGGGAALPVLPPVQIAGLTFIRAA